MWWWSAALLVVILAALYIRKHKDLLKRRFVPYRGALVPDDFWTTCAKTQEGSADRPLVVWIADDWLPVKRTETTVWAYELSRFLVRAAGWTVAVIVPDSPVASWDDMPILRFDQRPLVELAVRKAHCILTVGALARQIATETAINAKKRLVAVPDDITPATWLQPSALTVHPVFYPKSHTTHTTRTYITLIGCTEADGAKGFYELARQYPEWRFMAVEGQEGDQATPPRLANLRTVKKVEDLRGVFSETGILVVLGSTEQFPRRVLEAAASGIPTVGISSAGLQEALGDAGIFCRGLEEIAEKIRELLESPTAYETASRAARFRAKAAYNSTEELERLRLFLLDK
jgi:hypothetical protein